MKRAQAQATKLNSRKTKMAQEIIGADVDEVLALASGISGEDYVGDAVRSGVQMRQIINNTSRGIARRLYVALGYSGSVAAAGVATLSGSPARDFKADRIVLASDVASVGVTALTIASQNQLLNSGATIPAEAFFATSADPRPLSFDVCGSSQSISVALVNNNAAAAKVTGVAVGLTVKA
jgi:hypothetical protein